jgi:hypothetical protein
MSKSCLLKSVQLAETDNSNRNASFRVQVPYRRPEHPCSASCCRALSVVISGRLLIDMGWKSPMHKHRVTSFELYQFRDVSEGSEFD